MKSIVILFDVGRENSRNLMGANKTPPVIKTKTRLWHNTEPDSAANTASSFKVL